MGRVVIRVSSLSAFSDSAYGMEAEILAFDRDGRPSWRMNAPYVKILPFTLDTGPRITVLARALDRTDGTKQWEPVKEGLGENPPDGAGLTLNLGWDDFLLLSDIRRGTENLPVNQLLEASRITGNFGYIPQVFEAELIRRFAEPVFFLPFAVLVLVIGWRYRSLKRPRYLAVPMMAILPLVFNGAVHFFGSFLNNAGIWAVITLGFTGAIVCFAAGALILFIISLIILAAQHG
jgi:lipopolysaccharide export LptBFGC system permease protein LptF